MVRVKKVGADKFTIISNKLIRDESLSWKAKGLFSFLWSQADNWNFYESEVVKHSTDGISSLRSGLKELENHGYLKRTRERKKGKFGVPVWYLSEEGKFEKPILEKPILDKPILDNRTLSNTNSKKHQYKETLISSSSKPHNEKPTDPFLLSADSEEEENQKLNDLLDMFLSVEQGMAVAPQRKQILKLLHKMSLNDANTLVHQVIDSMPKNVHDPVAYLIASLKNAGD